MLTRKSTLYSPNKDFIYALLVFITGIIVTYQFPQIKNFFFLSIISVFIFSKKYDYFWIFIVLLFENAPSHFFTPSDKTHNLEILSLFGFRDLFFQEVFVIVALVKAIYVSQFRQVDKLFYRNFLKLLTIEIIILFVVGFFLGTGLVTFLKSIRVVLPFTLLFTLNRLFSELEDYQKFFELVFRFTSLVLVLQFSEILLFKTPLSAFLGGKNFLQDSIDIGARQLYSPWILLLALFGSLTALAMNLNYSSKNFYLFTLFNVLLSFLVSGTRGFFLGCLIAVLLAFLFIPRIKAKISGYFAVAIAVLLIVLSVAPFLFEFIAGATTRILTITDLIQGDVTAGGTLARLTIYSPKVMENFWQYPYLGMGFSDVMFENQNPHVGNQMLLMLSGIWGYGLMVLFILYFILKIYMRQTELSSKNNVKPVFSVIVFFLITLLFIHSSSAMVFSFMTENMSGSAIGLLCFFTFSSKIYHCPHH